MTEEEKREYLEAVMQEEEQSAHDFYAGRKRSKSQSEEAPPGDDIESIEQHIQELNQQAESEE